MGLLDRDVCLVPTCDEAPDPGEAFCRSHQRELTQELDRWRAALAAFDAGDPFPVLELFDEE